MIDSWSRLRQMALVIFLGIIWSPLRVVAQKGHVQFSSGGSASTRGLSNAATVQQSVYLFVPGITGYGTAPTSLLHGPSGVVFLDSQGRGYIKTDSGGHFDLTGLYASYCPSPASNVYILSMEGATGFDNSPVVIRMSALPVTCSNLPNVSGVNFGDLTTVAATYALAPFANISTTSFSTSRDNLVGLQNAFSYANSLVNGLTDTVNATLPSGAAVPVATINSLGNFVASCINYSQNSGPCYLDGVAATPPGGASPSNLLQGMLDIAKNPTNNVSQIYNLIPANSPHQPSLTSSPIDWRLFDTKTAVLLRSSKNPSIFGITVQFAVTVTASDSSVPTGIVSLANGSTNLGSAPLISGAATIYINSLSAGTNPLVATYSGDSTHQTSSTSISQAVQAGLTVNSGINPQDTTAIMDLTFQNTGTINVPQASSFKLNTTQRTVHMEAGYDVAGAPVMNFFPQLTNEDSSRVSTSPVSVVRYAGGQLTPFDNRGSPISLAYANESVPKGWPINAPVFNRGAPVLGSLVIPDIQKYATARKLSLTMAGPTATILFPMSAGTTLSWQYRQMGSGWIPSVLTVQTQNTYGTFTRQMQYGNLNLSDNPANDVARRAHGIPALSYPLPSAATATETAAQAAYPQQTNNPGTYTVRDFGGTQNVLFQHGFLASGSTWSRMTDWLNQDFTFGRQVVPSLAAKSELALQGQNLESIIQNAGGSQYILVGHSQGGLIDRYAAQYFQSQNLGNVQGVITVDTPHLGAALTLTGPAAIGQGLKSAANALFDSFGCFTPQDNVGCSISDAIYVGGDVLAQWAVGSVGALRDLTPGSTFLTHLNAAPELFPKAAIIGVTDQRWLVTRVVDSVLTGANPEDLAGERNIAKAFEGIYGVVVAGLGYSVYLEGGWISYCFFQGGSDSGDPSCDVDPYIFQIAQQANILSIMDNIDSFYNGLISPDGDGSDGFVQNSSQYYPSSNAVQLVISGADSHTVATRSTYDHAALDSLLSSIYKVATPAACIFTTNVPSVPVPVSGGNVSFSVITGSGCHWSAISDSPWLSISANSLSGIGTTTITANAQSLTSSVPRSGTIQIGNASNMTTITVVQSSSCSYSLKASPSGTYSDGSIGTVSVTTQTGCSWSALPNVKWIGLSNQSGVGSGSFEFHVYPACAHYATGQIDVMGQLLNMPYYNHALVCTGI